MAHCLIALGANLGDPAAQLDQARDHLCRLPQVTCVAHSRYYGTVAVGGPSGQPRYLNAALRIDTQLTPRALLAATRAIEQQLGRQRQTRWGPRTIDIDLLLYDTLAMESEQLVLPHPRMAVRRFVLDPAHDVAGDMVHPTTGWTVTELWARLAQPPHYVAVAGTDPALRAHVAARVARATGARWLRDPAPAPSDAAGPPSSAQHIAHLQAALQARRQQLLALPTAAGPAPPAWSVCDYWLPQSLATARGTLDEDARTALEAACRSALEQTPAPKCVLLLDPVRAAARPAAHRTRADGAQGAGDADAPAHELARIATWPRQSPVLHASADDPAAAVTELAAAIDAMR